MYSFVRAIRTGARRSARRSAALVLAAVLAAGTFSPAALADDTGEISDDGTVVSSADILPQEDTESACILPQDDASLIASSDRIYETVTAQASASASETTPAEPAAVQTTAQTQSSAAQATVTTAGGDVLTYVQALSCVATAYTGSGATATGTRARVGAIAVDPDVIPLGSILYIVSNDGYCTYGICTAEDTGSAIHGRRVDLYFSSYSECVNFGQRNVTVYVLSWGTQ